ncbi:MAG: hypothetical protein IKZ87_02695 [Actinomycetaceae bacterium]|nr:hypothetical protein [Actinomycetaceae bacterium]
MDRTKKTAASRIADVAVILISLLILFGGFLGVRVYQANPQRNAYDLAVGIFEDAHKEVDALRSTAEPLLDNCAERSGEAEACDALQAAYDASIFDEPKKLSRVTLPGTYEKETLYITEQTERARAVRDGLQTNIDTVGAGVEVTLERKVGPQRAQMRESAKVAASEISACQDVVDNSAGKVDDSIRSQAQAAIGSLQELVDEAEKLQSDNPEDYSLLNTQLRAGIANVTHWAYRVNNAYRG